MKIMCIQRIILTAAVIFLALVLAVLIGVHAEHSALQLGVVILCRHLGQRDGARVVEAAHVGHAVGGDAVQDAAARIAELSAFFPDTYVIDLRTYGPDFDGNFIKKFYLAGHLNPAGYLFVGRMVVSYIDYIVRHNLEDFREVGLNGIEYARADGTKKLLL